MTSLEQKLEELSVFVNSFNYPSLVGSEKQINWASDIRYRVYISLSRKIETMRRNPERYRDKERAVKQLDEIKAAYGNLMAETSAKYWIDNRDEEAGKLLVNHNK